jgi:hypothetical protein
VNDPEPGVDELQRDVDELQRGVNDLQPRVNVSARSANDPALEQGVIGD